MIYLSRPGPGREWFLKGVVAVEGRPNIETKKDIKVSIPENFKEKAKTESQGWRTHIPFTREDYESLEASAEKVEL